MFQWFDAIEVTFRQSGCPENLRIVNATGVFQSRALDWWTAERNRRGNDAAYGLTWEELRELMMKEFCPPHEVKKLENEFWNIKQDGGDNAGLTARFKQLSIICPSQGDTPDKTIKKYIQAPPDCLADFIQAVRPEMIEETYQLAAEINDKRVLAAHCRSSPRRQAPPAPPAPPAQPLAPQVNPAASAQVANARACYTCGDPNHFANVCPHCVVKQEPQQQPPPQQQPQQ
ncbi:uncharacterized protein LOC110893495 [Helianthus annuus]|uniref:uncharacterized protein LOC110893495 n=1 Tax=Helianthus annuus TaxID=4232 RepID=UPI000B90715E|nr:uncharacterized protein LOC110893495 [Helianthus annuus]